MDYLVVGLLLFVIGNLTYLERVCSKLQIEVKHIKQDMAPGKKTQEGGD